MLLTKSNTQTNHFESHLLKLSRALNAWNCVSEFLNSDTLFHAIKVVSLAIIWCLGCVAFQISISEKFGEKIVDTLKPQFRPKISTPLRWTAFFIFPLTENILYNLMISWLRTILGSQILETFMVSTISKVPFDQLVLNKLGINWQMKQLLKNTLNFYLNCGLLISSKGQQQGELLKFP